MKLDQEVYDEIVRRLLSLRQLSAELSDAYEDPVAKQGADEMRASLERVLRLLGHPE
jgi:hypothetical protein